MKINKIGFSLFELLIVLSIIALMSSAIVPITQRSTARYEREQFVARLNALTQLGWQRAITTGKVHRLRFDFSNYQILLEVEVDTQDSGKEPSFALTKGSYISTKLVIPDQFEVKQFFVEGFDEMSRFAGKKTGQAWFFIIPEGLTQDVVITMVDTKDRVEKKSRPVSLLLNPFVAQFIEEQGFTKR